MKYNRLAVVGAFLLATGGASAFAQDRGIVPHPFPVSTFELASLFLRSPDETISAQQLETMQRVYFGMACRGSFGVMYELLGTQVEDLEEWSANAREFGQANSREFEQRQQQLADNRALGEEARLSANAWREFARVGFGALSEMMPGKVREEVAADTHEALYAEFHAFNGRLLEVGRSETDYLQLCPPGPRFVGPWMVVWD